MPDAPESSAISPWSLLAFAVGSLALAWVWSMAVLVALAGTYALIVIGSVWRHRRMQSLADQRGEESICTFVRAFDYRSIDPWILRAVYEEMQDYIGIAGFPVRASDRIEEDLGLDRADIEDIVMDRIAYRTGRRLEAEPKNPLCGKIKSVRDIVIYFQHQHKRNAASYSDERRG